MRWRALTVKQPWAWAICHAGKDVENRSWPIPPKLFNQPCEYCMSGSVGEYHVRGEHMPGCRSSDRIHAGPCWARCEECGGSSVESLRVMLHAGAAWDEEGAGWVYRNRNRIRLVADSAGPHGHGVRNPDDGIVWWQPFGAVVAVVEFTGCHNPSVYATGIDNHPFTWGCRGESSHCSEWAQIAENGDPLYHWEIGAVHVLDSPVAAKGRQRLWFPDGDVVAAVEAQL